MARPLSCSHCGQIIPRGDVDPRPRRFSGPAEHEEPETERRLTGQIERVYSHLRDAATRGVWCSVASIATATGDPEPSVSAQIRNLRKPQFGRHSVIKRHMGGGLYVFRLQGD